MEAERVRRLIQRFYADASCELASAYEATDQESVATWYEVLTLSAEYESLFGVHPEIESLTTEVSARLKAVGADLGAERTKVFTIEELSEIYKGSEVGREV